ncbi:MAG: DUF188 domain-containing protein [Treponemataceae bacterium]|nr:DUF188 domain-containing protein [Treponemataceae bacterium]
MKILVDADSCPRLAREFLVKTIQRRKVTGIFAANRSIPGIDGPHLRMEVCPAKKGAADDRLVELAEPGDIVISRDIPLAFRLIEKNVTVLDDRGRRYSKENIRELLSIRDFTVQLASDGIEIERRPQYGRRELKQFADALDRELAKYKGSSLASS